MGMRRFTGLIAMLGIMFWTVTAHAGMEKGYKSVEEDLNSTIEDGRRAVEQKKAEDLTKTDAKDEKKGEVKKESSGLWWKVLLTLLLVGGGAAAAMGGSKGGSSGGGGTPSGNDGAVGFTW